MHDSSVGRYLRVDAVCALSRFGKAAASMTATMLVEKLKVTHSGFTGQAGSSQLPG
jgi:adenosylhomocysteine nucleosidase